MTAACPDCLRRSWLLARLSGHLDAERARLSELLDLGDEDLITAVAGREEAAVRREWSAFDPGGYGRGCAAAGIEVVCRCDPAYPGALWSLPAEPAALHVVGGMGHFLELVARDVVAIVGARRASAYGLEQAGSLARGLARAGITVLSGMALGIDGAAHAGALEVGGRTVAVLAAAPQRAYPRSAARLHRRIHSGGAGALVSELGPDAPIRKWMFPARNRIIAALAEMTVVVAAGRGSGAMLTANVAQDLGRELGAVPGSVTAPLSWGPHALLRSGARVVAEPADVLMALFGAGGRPDPVVNSPAAPSRLQPLLDALAEGLDPVEAFTGAGLTAPAGLAALAELELTGYVRRGPGGRFTVVS